MHDDTTGEVQDPLLSGWHSNSRWMRNWFLNKNNKFWRNPSQNSEWAKLQRNCYRTKKCCNLSVFLYKYNYVTQNNPLTSIPFKNSRIWLRIVWKNLNSFYQTARICNRLQFIRFATQNNQQLIQKNVIIQIIGLDNKPRNSQVRTNKEEFEKILFGRCNKCVSHGPREIARILWRTIENTVQNIKHLLCKYLCNEPANFLVRNLT